MIIQGRVNRRKVNLLGSDVLRYEVIKIEKAQKRAEAVKNIAMCRLWIEQHEAIRALAEDLIRSCGLGARDALHLAAAAMGKAERFLTCDQGIVRKTKRINAVLARLNQKLAIENPVIFLQTFKEA